jgi:hypothetical protein
MRAVVVCWAGMAKREPKSRSRKKAPTLPGFDALESPTHFWVNRDVCIVRDGDWRRLFFHGTQAASWREGETAIRNALLVQLAQEPRIILEDLAKAFELTSEAVRLIRRKAEAEGLLAVMLPAKRKSTAVAPELRDRMENLFSKGKNVDQVFKTLGKKVARSTISKYRARWAGRAERAPKEPEQRSLALATASRAEQQVQIRAEATDAGAAEAELGEIRVKCEKAEYRLHESATEAAEEKGQSATASIEERAPQSRRGVQHAGAWLLIASASGLGLHESARELAQDGGPLRVALDAVLAALAIGEGCVEGVRRLATRAGAALVVANAAPSATWCRRTLGSVARRSERFHQRFATGLLRTAHREAQRGRPVVFYVDNHTREYTGEELLAWHWKMQRKRAVRGVTDYWIHDERGRPISAVTAFQQGSMVEFLPACAKVVRSALGREPRVLVVFDRGGAFPAAMADLQMLPEGPVEFLTYERAPFARHGREYFERHGEVLVLADRDDKKQRVAVLDGGTYLGQGRGKVRRLSLLLPDNNQINLLTSSLEDAQWLVQTLFARWTQENAFKYGKERWGFDQLDSRQVVPYPKGTIIPNPYRANLERSRERAAQQEGKLRCRLARLPHGETPEKAALKKSLANVVETASLIKGALSRTARHIPVEKTHLDGRLVHHQREYKLLVDTLRVAGMNAEDQLARMLRPHLTTEAEAKRILQNLIKATGNIQVGESGINVVLDPSANRAELRAMAKLLAEVNHRNLVHPADPQCRHVQFRLRGVHLPQGA